MAVASICSRDINQRWWGRCICEVTLMPFEFLAPEQAWKELVRYRDGYYRQYAAAYSGDRKELRATASPGSFWKRASKCKIHVPIAADIAATSADLLFAEETGFTCYDEATEDNESAQQHRLDSLVLLNNLHGKLNEAAETSAALGDVCLKLNWNPDEIPYPVLTVVQGDSAWPEYLFGVLQGIHFFSVIRYDADKGKCLRIYERYEKGRILMALYEGTANELGVRLSDEALAGYGYSPEITAPVDEMLAVHVPNIRPNRRYRDSQHGRSDFDELRDMTDSLDEAYSSWMRDIRLAKARLIVPAEYLKRKDVIAEQLGGKQFTYEFDEDVETLVALDIDTQYAGSNPITPSQFEIRSTEHAATCADLMHNIVSIAGYAPQTFGMDIDGMAQSGTALHIREKKSYNTRGKKMSYWRAPLEAIMTAMIHLDAVLFPDEGSDMDDTVKVSFPDSMSNDLSTVSAALQMINAAAAVSTEIKVAMLHPDWTKKQVAEEVERIKTETGLSVINPDMGLGDFENSVAVTEDE